MTVETADCAVPLTVLVAPFAVLVTWLTDGPDWGFALGPELGDD